ncbi:MAG: hypothetical protein AMK72_10740 [Planctomycetes bacterium SM23_25]|nr:MAG: hypothetical protein AMK72_10740 [Planctomycetes bacterium SM23_25]
MTLSPHILLQTAWMAAAVGLALCSVGCEDPPEKGAHTPILPSEADDALVNGQFDASRIACVIVYLHTLWPDCVEELGKCRNIIKIVGEPAISEFVESLKPEADKGLGKPAQFARVQTQGVLEVVLKDGRSLYLGYWAQEYNQQIRAPSAYLHWEGPGHGRKAWREWMLRYVYDTERHDHAPVP